MTPAAFGHNFLSAGNNRQYCISAKIELSNCIRSTDVQGVPEVLNDDSMPLTLDLLNPKSMSFDRLSRSTTLSSFMLFRSGFSFYRANISR